MVEREDVELLVVAWFHRLSISKACRAGGSAPGPAHADGAREPREPLGARPRAVCGTGRDGHLEWVGRCPLLADLFVVCKQCGSEVSPYITECPYCGHRLRRRAPDLPRGGARAPRAARGGCACRASSAAPRARAPARARCSPRRAPAAPAGRAARRACASTRGPTRRSRSSRSAARAGSCCAGATWRSTS